MADSSVKESTLVDSSSKNKNKKWIQKYKAEYSQSFNFVRKSSVCGLLFSFIYTCRQGMGHMVFTDCTLWWLPNYAIFLPSGAQISSLFWGLVFLIVIVPGWHLCVISFTSV